MIEEKFTCGIAGEGDERRRVGGFSVVGEGGHGRR